MQSELNTVLVLAPHTDDAELGCGGTIAKLCSAGVNVHCAVFSDCEESLPDGFASGTLRIECRAALGHLGLHAEHITIQNRPVRRFPSSRQEILELLVKLGRELVPDLVFLPAASDIHQDHDVIHREGVRAFKRTRLLGYQFPWNCTREENRFFVELGESDLQRKIDAIACYKSQEHRAYVKADFLTATALNAGVTSCCYKYAEKFELIRWFL